MTWLAEHKETHQSLRPHQEEFFSVDGTEKVVNKLPDFGTFGTKNTKMRFSVAFQKTLS